MEKSEEKVKSMGIVTIRTTRETMPYTVKGIVRNKATLFVSLIFTTPRFSQIIYFYTFQVVLKLSPV